MAFWVALIYHGARAAGLQELHSSGLEEGVPLFPNMYPDTEAGQAWETEQWLTQHTKFQRIPPAKRPSYIKLGVNAPFHFPWAELTAEWVKMWTERNKFGSSCQPEKEDTAHPSDPILNKPQENNHSKSVIEQECGKSLDSDPNGSSSQSQSSNNPGDGAPTPQTTTRWSSSGPTERNQVSDNTKQDRFFVLRSKSLLAALCSHTGAVRKVPARKTDTAAAGMKRKVTMDVHGCTKAARSALQQSSVHDMEVAPSTDNASLEKVEAKPSSSSITSNVIHSITLPYSDYLSQSCLVLVQVRMILRGTPSPHSMICLPTSADLAAFEADPQHDGPCEPHHRDADKQRRKQAKALLKKQRSQQKLSKGSVLVSAQETEDVPPRVSNVIDNTSRLVIGYVKEGRFSYSMGRGCGLGFVTLQGLVKAVEQRKRTPLVLTRSPQSYQYRLATLSVVQTR